MPKQLQAAIGKVRLIESLSTQDERQANRAAIPVIAKFEELLRLAERGEYTISSRVNSVRNDGPGLVEPMQAGEGLRVRGARIEALREGLDLAAASTRPAIARVRFTIAFE